eukprot:jgi/Galph1/5046/GphlegSOOS_G3794.1
MFIYYFENLSNISRLGKLLLGMLRTEPSGLFLSFKVSTSVDLAPSLVVGIVCKGCWKSEGLNWSDIIISFPIHDQIVSESLKTFIHKIIFNSGNRLNYESCCYSSGSLIGDTFKIPTNCELVIVSENDLEMFIGKEILTGLGRVFARTDKPTLDLIGTDFMQQICSCLMF